MTLALPRHGMGTAGIGNLYAPVTNAEAHAAVAAAWASGIRFFDTAPHYGFGLAERRLGDALAALDPAQSAIVSTKVGRTLAPTASPARQRHGFVDADPFEPVFDYGRDAVLRSHEESLGRLRRDRVNILFAHDLGTRTHGADAGRHMRRFLDEGYPAMAELKAAGAVDLIGIGVNETQVCELLLRHVDLDVVLLAGRYTLLDQSAAEHVLPLCVESGVRFVAAAPYNSGILSRPTGEASDPHYDYAPPSPRLLERSAEIEQVCARFGVSLPAAALQFPAQHPGVACVLAGLSREAEVSEHLERWGEAIPKALWAELAARGLVQAAAPSTGMAA